MDTPTRIALETLYHALLPLLTRTQAIDVGLHCQLRSLVVELARVLDKPSPIVSRAERRQQRKSVLQ